MRCGESRRVERTSATSASRRRASMRRRSRGPTSPRGRGGRPRRTPINRVLGLPGRRTTRCAPTPAGPPPRRSPTGSSVRRALTDRRRRRPGVASAPRRFLCRRISRSLLSRWRADAASGRAVRPNLTADPVLRPLQRDVPCRERAAGRARLDGEGASERAGSDAHVVEPARWPPGVGR